MQTGVFTPIAMQPNSLLYYSLGVNKNDLTTEDSKIYYGLALAILYFPYGELRHCLA